MGKATLSQILGQLNSLKLEELHQLHRAVEEYFPPQDEEGKREAFHRALLASGLVKQIKKPNSYQKRELVQVQGKSVSETIIEERR